ncbi:MAG: IS66 family insertion sequence element accessory protein TnpA, partial [Planctomycetaceae bacterium]
MNNLEQVWCERIDGVQASGLTIAEASAQHGLSVSSVYRWKKLMAESPVPERHPAGQSGKALRYTRFQPQRSPDCSAKQRRDPCGRRSGWRHVLVHRVEESRRAANCKRDQRECRRRLASPSAGAKTPPASSAPAKTGPSKSDAAKPDATSRGPECDLATDCCAAFPFERCRCALGHKFMRRNCNRQSMTDPCNSALHSLPAQVKARTCRREPLRCSLAL